MQGFKNRAVSFFRFRGCRATGPKSSPSKLNSNQEISKFDIPVVKLIFGKILASRCGALCCNTSIIQSQCTVVPLNHIWKKDGEKSWAKKCTRLIWFGIMISTWTFSKFGVKRYLKFYSFFLDLNYGSSFLSNDPSILTDTSWKSTSARKFLSKY